MDLGFIQAGFECIAAFDIEKDAVDIYRQNIGNHIEHMNLNSLNESFYKKLQGIQVLLAGPPCQGFSTAGKNDPNDLRNNLLLTVAEIAGRLLPKVVVIENVKGLLSPLYVKHRESLFSALTNFGYTYTTSVLEASHLGISQSRKRVIIVAVLGDKAPEMNLKRKTPLPLKDLLINIKDEENHKVKILEEGSTPYLIAKHIKPGQKLSNVRGGSLSVHTWDIPEVYGETSAEEKDVLDAIRILRRKNRKRLTGDADPVEVGELAIYLNKDPTAILNSLTAKKYIRPINEDFDLTNVFNGMYRRLSSNGIAPTVDTRFGHPRYFLHPIENRGFSVREAARLQGFPDTFRFSVSTNSAFRLIGNAVPPPMAKSIAKLISNKVFNR